MTAENTALGIALYIGIYGGHVTLNRLDENHNLTLPEIII